MASVGTPYCPVCHLPLGGRPPRRHHECPFCERTFSRVDGAKRHIKSCPSRGNRQIPDDAKRGRKRHACDKCTKVKVSCDSKSPCSRCASRNLNCTYGRFCTDPTHAAKTKPTEARLPVESDDMALPFLLACTDPAVGTVDGVILTGEPERDIGESEALQPDNDVSSETIDPSLLFLGFFDPYFGMDMEFNGMNDDTPTLLSLDLGLDETQLITRVSLLESELQQTAAAKHLQNHKQYDPSMWASFFTPQSFNKCINVFFHRDQLLATIIHKPTFHSDKVDLRLLLAIVVSGYSYLNHRSKGEQSNYLALALREIAGEYILHYVEQFLGPANVSSDTQHTLELCQAAYIIVTLQAGVKDVKIRQRAITRAHPMLVTLLRNLDMMGVKHDWSETSDWSTFVYKESCIRLAHWTFINDAWLSLFSNYPPAMTLLDMTGDLPCEDDLWAMDAVMGSDNERLRERSNKAQGTCLKSLMSKLLVDEWTPHTVALYTQLDVKHFLVTIVAFQHVIFQYESALLPESGLSLLARGLQRWAELWGSALDRIDPEQRKSLGLVRYSTELSFLFRKMVELSRGQEDVRLRYLDRRVVYDTTALHQLIQHCSK